MSTTITSPITTKEKLLRARDASAKLALFSTDEKNALLLAIAESCGLSRKSTSDARLRILTVTVFQRDATPLAIR